MVTSIGLPPDLEPEVMTSQRSSLWGAWLRHAGWAVAGVGTVTGRAKPRGGLPGGNVSQGCSAALGGWVAKCTLRAAWTPGGRKSLKRTPGGRPRGRGSCLLYTSPSPRD